MNKQLARQFSLPPTTIRTLTVFEMQRRYKLEIIPLLESPPNNKGFYSVTLKGKKFNIYHSEYAKFRAATNSTQFLLSFRNNGNESWLCFSLIK